MLVHQATVRRGVDKAACILGTASDAHYSPPLTDLLLAHMARLDEAREIVKRLRVITPVVFPRVIFTETRSTASSSYLASAWQPVRRKPDLPPAGCGEGTRPSARADRSRLAGIRNPLPKRPSSRLSISGTRRVGRWSRYLSSEIASAAKSVENRRSALGRGLSVYHGDGGYHIGGGYHGVGGGQRYGHGGGYYGDGGA